MTAKFDAKRAREELQTTQNSGVVGGGAEALAQQLFPLTNQRRTEQAAAATSLAESLFQLAAELDHTDRRWKIGLASLYWTSASRKRTGNSSLIGDNPA